MEAFDESHKSAAEQFPRGSLYKDACLTAAVCKKSHPALATGTRVMLVFASEQLTWTPFLPLKAHPPPSLLGCTLMQHSVCLVTLCYSHINSALQNWSLCSIWSNKPGHTELWGEMAQTRLFPLNNPFVFLSP